VQAKISKRLNLKFKRLKSKEHSIRAKSTFERSRLSKDERLKKAGKDGRVSSNKPFKTALQKIVNRTSEELQSAASAAEVRVQKSCSFRRSRFKRLTSKE
jgi:hypothetical protein